jgi:hypothetical protein
MLCVLTEHAVFTQTSTIKQAVAAKMDKYDGYDINNDQDAVSCLQNSLSADLKRELDGILPKKYKEMGFILWWLCFVSVYYKHTTPFLREKEDQIKCLHPSKFAGQNIIQFVGALKELAEPLLNAQQYDHELTEDIIGNLLTAGGPSESPSKMIWTAAILRFQEKHKDARDKC